MADVYGVNATSLRTTPPTRVTNAQRGGVVRVKYDEYEASALATGSEIVVGELKAGDTLLPISFLMIDDLGSGSDAVISLVLETLDDATETSVIASIDVDAAAATTIGSAIANIAAFPAVVAEDSLIKLKFTGTTAATGTIKSYMFFTSAAD